MKYGKTYPYLKALLDALIVATPNWMNAIGTFISSLSEQLQDKGKEENKKLEQEITRISKDELRELIKEAGYERKEDIEPIVEKVQLIPNILQTLNYHFDKVDEKLEQILELVQQKQTVFYIKKQEFNIGNLFVVFPTAASAKGTQLEKLKAIVAADLAPSSAEFEKFKIEEKTAKRDIYQATRDIVIQRTLQPEQAVDKVKLDFPFAPSLHNQVPPEENFVGREEYLKTITDWYKSDNVRIGALIGWGGVGKSALVRKWYDSLKINKIQPDGIFWWGFYRNAYLEQFLNALFRYVAGGQIQPDTIKSTWEKVERIKEYIGRGAYLIILDGLEQMQKSESGDEFGKMNYREFTELLHYLADLPKAKGLCLITTRFALKDLDDWETRGYENQPLIDLSINDALLMLKKRGIKGSDYDMTEIIKKYKGHALSLTALSGYLNRYYVGDIKQAPEVEFVIGDKIRFHMLLSKYAENMSVAELVFLNIFSLFWQEVTKKDFAGVFRAEMETEMNQVLIDMSEFAFKRMVDNLVDRRLISRDQENNYATHPLIKSYFESIFDQEDKKLCHKRIYEYIGEYAPERPETLEQMQPLFEQVYHGCAAGLYDETKEKVFEEKIERYGEHFIYHKLGAWETTLSLTKMFFPEGDVSQMPLVSRKSDQSWVLAVAGLALLNTGRPKEAEELLFRKTNMQIKYKDWRNASGGYQNLADLQFRTGELESGLDSAKEALEMAEKVNRYDYVVFSKSYLGWILYLLGESKEAERSFIEVDELSIQIEGNRLRTFAGVQYAYFLISMKRIDEAFELTKQNLEICQRNNFVNDISRCHRCLGAIERINGNRKQAEVHLQEALKIARKIGVPELEIGALLERGRLWLDIEDEKGAIADANDVLKICSRTGFRFYEPAAEIVLGKAYLAQKNYEQAERFAKSAYEKAVGMKYRWAECDAGHLLGEIYIASGDKTKARKWLQKAVACRKEIKDPKVKESKRMLESL